jgi:polyphosphate kinase
MYRGYEILSQGAFRITRNSNLYLQEEEARNLLESVRTELSNRRKGDAVRLEIEEAATKRSSLNSEQFSSCRIGRFSRPKVRSTCHA